MSESPFVIRQQPHQSSSLEELTTIVRPPGNPFAIKVFTDTQEAAAQAYAAEHGTEVQRFPLDH